MASAATASTSDYGSIGNNIRPPTRTGPAYEQAKGGKGSGYKDQPKQVKNAGVHNILANRCAGFNNGICKPGRDGGNICSRNASLLHLCSKCGGKHAWADCSQVRNEEKEAIGADLKRPWRKDDQKQKQKKGKKGNGGKGVW